MPIVPGKAMERRTFLRGMGAVVALPYLDAMEPAFRSLAKVRGEKLVRKEIEAGMSSTAAFKKYGIL